jgi:hypothetical protein
MLPSVPPLNQGYSSLLLFLLMSRVESAFSFATVAPVGLLVLPARVGSGYGFVQFCDFWPGLSVIKIIFCNLRLHLNMVQGCCCFLHISVVGSCQLGSPKFHYVQCVVQIG